MPPKSKQLEEVTYEEWKEQKSVKKRRNAADSAEILIEEGIYFESKNGGIHLIVSHEGYVVDFWPSTGKFIDRERKDEFGRGVFNLLKHIRGH